MSNYPPGVTGNEPQITGKWPCRDCSGQGYDEDEDGKHACKWCGGTGIEPEEPPYCRNCDNENYEKLWCNPHKDLFVCDQCRDPYDQPEPEWESWF